MGGLRYNMRFRFRALDLFAVLVIWTAFVCLVILNAIGPLNPIGVVCLAGCAFWFVVGMSAAIEEEIRPDLSGVPRSEM